MEEVRLNEEIIEVPIEKIKPHEGSHKTDNSVDLLVESLKEFGINQPISIDKNYVIVTGNGVYKAALKAGFKTIPCIVVDYLTDEQVKQYRIADDKTSDFASWNQKKLRQELSYLDDPKSMQPYFDFDVMRMLGLNTQALKVAPPTDTSNDSIRKIELDEQALDNRFKEHLKSIERDAVVSSTGYVEYICSKCGKKVKVKRK